MLGKCFNLPVLTSCWKKRTQSQINKRRFKKKDHLQLQVFCLRQVIFLKHRIPQHVGKALLVNKLYSVYFDRACKETRCWRKKYHTSFSHGPRKCPLNKHYEVIQGYMYFWKGITYWQRRPSKILRWRQGYLTNRQQVSMVCILIDHKNHANVQTSTGGFTEKFWTFWPNFYGR